MSWRPSGSPTVWRKRAGLLRAVREFFHARSVLEVDTPVLGRTTVTDPAIDSFAVDIGGERWYLQTSPEYHMKRLLAAGAPSIYRLGPVFRAEESGGRHNPEFTMLEWYRLGFSLRELMTEVGELVDQLIGADAYRHITYAGLLREQLGLSATASPRQVREALGGDVSPEISGRGVFDLALSVALRRLGRGRYFITDYPADQAALARVRENEDGEPVARRFELVVDGMEIANGYDELTDSTVLEARMAADGKERAREGRPSPGADRRLLAAMEAGLPRCAGVAVGFDRLVMLATGAAAIDDVLTFPFSRA